MKHSMAMFEINENNELIMSCKGPVGESHFQFSVPVGYTPTDHMPNLTFEQWKLKIQNAAFDGEISAELASKALASLDRLPDLEPGQKVCASFSNGKDSQALMLLTAMKYPKDRIMALFADTKDEWPETYDFQPVFESWIGIPITTLETEGIHELLRHRMPFWPMMKRRHCTKNCKMIPQRDYLDQQGYDQIRLQGRAKNPPKAKFRSGELLDVKYPAPVMLCGERWSESTNRSELPHDSRDDVILRYTHRPVLEFTIEEIWELIFWMRAPYNQVYHFVRRCACAGCPFASEKEIETLGEHHPDKLDEWCETERYINHPWKGIGFSTIRARLIRSGRYGRMAVSKERKHA